MSQIITYDHDMSHFPFLYTVQLKASYRVISPFLLEEPHTRFPTDSYFYEAQGVCVQNSPCNAT